MPPSTPVVHLNLRLPPELHRHLAEWAGREHRSLHAQVLHVLTGAMERETARQTRQCKAAPTE